MLQNHTISHALPVSHVLTGDPSTRFELVVDREELARRLMVSPSFISKLMAEEGLPHLKIGRSVRFDVDEIKAWLKQRRRP